MSKKIRVGVIFGGRSGEHEVSLRSAHSIIDAIDKNRYEVVPIGITREGKWVTTSQATELLPEAVITATEQVALFGDPTHRGLVHVGSSSLDKDSLKTLDVIFPVLHGTYGEDGTIQGLLEMADVAYVGCGVLASSVGMDKVMMKKVFQSHGLPVGPYTYFLRSAWEKDKKAIIGKISREFEPPLFVKPANLGSSVGISKVKSFEQLEASIDLAARYDRKIVIEKGLNVREYEIAVLGNDEPIASLPGEVIPGAEFYDYNDKYIDNKTRFEIPATLAPGKIAQMQQLAIAAFQAIDASGLARIDFFVEKETGELILNEINTMPGFTSISMYPKLWAVSGLSYEELIERLITLAIERKKEASKNITTL
ncbi:MAG: D-alanine--D-alanine ligase [Blastocatellia bacterium]|nr:D-alanine--D-alanine ligase [Blastocatellia bacterium]